MSLNDTPSGERIHISFFGRRNAGKSSIVNAVTGQSLAVVSDVEGTTTDPVKKSMELLPLGPVLIIDTPGFDDVGSLGKLRVQKTKQVLGQTDLAVLVIDSVRGVCECDKELLDLFSENELPCIIAWNKCDEKSIAPLNIQTVIKGSDIPVVHTSAITGEGIQLLKEKIGDLYNMLQARHSTAKNLVSDLLNCGDQVILVIPIDKAAPKGRLILPQQQVIRDLLDAHCVAICTQDPFVRQTIEGLQKPPAMVITDSQVFASVQKDVPDNIPLTSFSVLMARYKGFLKNAVGGVTQIDRLQNGDRILIAEGCTHHRQCEDIGTVKLPCMLKKYSGKDLRFETCSGSSFPEDLTPYALIIHCGGCMLNTREVQTRTSHAMTQGIPITNYGIVIAYMNGILHRSIAMIPDIVDMLI